MYRVGRPMVDYVAIKEDSVVQIIGGELAVETALFAESDVAKVGANN